MTRKKIILFFLFALLISKSMSAQIDSIANNTKDIFRRIELGSNGNIEFTQSDSLHNLVLKHIARNRRQEGIPGYRIRIFSDVGKRSRMESRKTRTTFYEKYPDIPVYREYDSPYFKVYVGDFRTKMEAIKCLKKIKHNFPDAFVVPDRINYPEIE